MLLDIILHHHKSKCLAKNTCKLLAIGYNKIITFFDKDNQMEKEKQKVKQNIHADHRKRVKEKFKSTGLKTFAPHEILEMLLFYSIPLADTNPTAHALLEKYKTLPNVFDASLESLTSTPGVGEHSALLIKLIPAIMQVYNQEKSKRLTQINNQNDAKSFFENLYKGASNEQFYILCLTADSQIISTTCIASGDSNRVDVQIKTVTDHILKSGASRVIIAHNHPISKPEPSDEDVTLTHRLCTSCILNDIELLDHVIASPYGCYSFAESTLMDKIIRDVIINLHVDPTDFNFQKFRASQTEYVIL